jgi:hypothetical protein
MKIPVTTELIEQLKTQFPQGQFDPESNTPIKGAVSPETAVFITDYPYGFRLRCVKRIYLETRKGYGTRVVSQTTNPKAAGIVWNKPKAGTYHDGIVVLNINDDGEQETRVLSPYHVQGRDGAALLAKFEQFKHAFTERETNMFTVWSSYINKKEAAAKEAATA